MKNRKFLLRVVALGASLGAAYYFGAQSQRRDTYVARAEKFPDRFTPETLLAAVPVALAPLPASADSLKASFIAKEYYERMVNIFCGESGYKGSVTMHVYLNKNPATRLMVPFAVAGRQLAMEVSVKLSSGEDRHAVQDWANQQYRKLVETVGYDFTCSSNACYGVTTLIQVLDKPNHLSFLDLKDLGEQPDVVICAEKIESR